MDITADGEITKNDRQTPGDGGGISLTNKRNVGGVDGLSMGGDAVGKVNPKNDADIDIWGKGSVPYDGKGIGGTNFLGPGPDLNPFEIPDPNNPGEYLRPIDEIDRCGQMHDYMYWKSNTGGVMGALFNHRVTGADMLLMATAKDIMERYNTGGIDRVTGYPISERTYNISWAVYNAFSFTVANKVNPSGIRY